MPKPNTKDPLIVSKVIQLSAEGRTIKEICENIHKSNKTVIKVQKENYTQIQELKKELTSIITEKTKQLYTDTIKLSLEKAQLALKYITPEKIAAASSAANATTYAILIDKYHIGTGQAAEAASTAGVRIGGGHVLFLRNASCGREETQSEHRPARLISFHLHSLAGDIGFSAPRGRLPLPESRFHYSKDIFLARCFLAVFSLLRISSF